MTMNEPVMHPSILHRQAFTLVEMLVVLSIMGVLAGLLFPAVGVVRSRMDVSKCLSQISQFGHGIGAYRADFSGSFPSRRMLVGYSYRDAGIADTTTSQFANDGSADGELFFAMYMQVDRTKYGQSYRTTGLDPFFKCPAMLKLNPNSRSSPLAANETDYRYTYQPNAKLDRESPITAARAGSGVSRLHGNTPLMFCGGTQSWRAGVSTYLGGSSPAAPQFPHFANPDQPDGVGADFKMWYTKGKCSVLKADGSSQCQAAWISNWQGYLTPSAIAKPYMDFDRYIGLVSPTVGSSSPIEAMGLYWNGQ